MLIDDGYVVLRGMVPDELVRGARRMINRQLGTGRQFSREEAKTGVAFASIRDDIEIPVFAQLFNRSAVLPVVESLIGSVDLVRSSAVQVALRFPNAGERLSGLHIDGEYGTSGISCFTTIAACFLSDCLDTDSGNLAVIPGSHRLVGELIAESAVRLPRPDGSQLTWDYIEPMLAARLGRALPAPTQIKASAGDVALFHGLLVHGPSCNMSAEIRYALIVRFVPHGSDYRVPAGARSRLTDMWCEWPGLRNDLTGVPECHPAPGTGSVDDPVKVIHVIARHNGSADVNRRVELFLRSVAGANRDHVLLLNTSSAADDIPGWQGATLPRDARAIGDPAPKPFVKDLFDAGLAHAAPGDWILVTNCDCPVASDIYADLRRRRGTVVEYMRRNVTAYEHRTLDEILGDTHPVYEIGIDGLAIRARYYEEIRHQLPDLFIAAPHWDTVYSGILRRLGPVRVSTDKLFHPDHAPTWSNGSPAARYNAEIYDEALRYGHLARPSICVDAERTDTAVIIVSWGTDPLRAAAHARALERLLRQDLYCDFHLVEIVEEGRQSIYPAALTESVRHVVIAGRYANRDLFQKEALMNIGWSTALREGGYEYFVFVDADVYADDPTWLRQIRARLSEDFRRVVQGFQLVEDSEDPRIRYCSLMAGPVLGYQTDLPANPGICWGMHRSTLELAEGFNPYFIDGFGDSGFVAEFIDPPGRVFDHGLELHHWAARIRRQLHVSVVPDCVPVQLVHVHHGPLSERNYHCVRRVIGTIGKPLASLVGLDDRGLLHWLDPDCPERMILRERRTLLSDDDVSRAEMHFRPGAVQRRSDDGDRRSHVWSRAYGNGYQAILEQWLAGAGHARRPLNLFNPAQVFSSHFPYSWCCNVRNANAEARIPVIGEAIPPELDLDAQDGADWFMATLPITSNWSLVDLSAFERLTLAVRVERCRGAEVALRLVSMDQRRIEHQSAEISLDPLEPDMVYAVSRRLDEFATTGFDITRVRRFDFLGRGNFRARIGQVVLR